MSRITSGLTSLAGLIRHYERRRRFWRHVRTAGPDDCWAWVGPCGSDGYGRFDGGFAHVRAYELANGTLAPPASVEQSCGNRRCVNPRHLEPSQPSG